MKRYQTPGLILVAIMAAFWAYMLTDNLIREFSRNITCIDLGVIFVLGLISGIALGLIYASKREQSAAG